MIKQKINLLTKNQIIMKKLLLSLITIFVFGFAIAQNCTELFISELAHVDALGAATLPLANIFEVPGYFYI